MIDAHLDLTTPCIAWTGALNEKGYGKAGKALAHRVEFERLVAPIPAGLVIDHVCRMRSFVNVFHLRAVTPRENTMAEGSLAVAKAQAEKTECKHGHRFTAANTYVDARGRRQCRTCHNDASRRRYARSVTDPEWLETKRARNRANQRAYEQRKKSRSA